MDSALQFAAAARTLASQLAPSATVVDAIPAALWPAVAVLCEKALRFDPAYGLWPDRDRFVVSSPRLLPLRQAFLRLAGRSEDESASTETTGELYGLAGGLAGQAVASATGMALGEKILARRFGHSLVNHRTWLIALSGDLYTGVALEAAILAGRFGLDRLTIIVAASDPQTMDGNAAEEDIGQMLGSFEASGWSTRRADASDTAAISAAITSSQRGRKPSLILCEAGSETPSTSVSVSPAALWDPTKSRGRAARRAWLRRLNHHAQRAEFERIISGRLTSGLDDDFNRGWTGQQWTENQSVNSAQTIIRAGLYGHTVLSGLLPEFTTLRTSNLRHPPSRRKTGPGVSKAGPLALGKSYVCGPREPAMVGMMNGLALHGGVIPCGMAPLHSVDRMRPALRFAALAKQRLICALIESDPDLGAGMWQQVEQLASLRAMPNLALFRPANAREAAAAWSSALAWRTGPSVIVFGRTSAPPCPADALDQRETDTIDGPGALSGPSRGGYIIEFPVQDHGKRDVTLIASGPEIAVARRAKALLDKEGLLVALVSLPCWELFTRQDHAYRAFVLGEAPRVAIEAASGFGWERWLGGGGVFIGTDEFDLASCFGALYQNFGITPEAIRDHVHDLLGTTRTAADPHGGLHH
ncbi:transketolase-like TK C-terminal-containing protein [Acetobacter fallax]|uniref:transketolase-like TK C-terminal-containing protein n=1 Tax=Acetobacter fallax TaxID=1737473 RepID=UPI00156A8DED|nr:transketolase [Acetobacter fallax]